GQGGGAVIQPCVGQRQYRSPALRRSALAALQPRPADDSLQLLGAALALAGHDEDATADLLAAVAQLPQREATGLSARHALSGQAGPATRVAALGLLAARPGSAPLLQRFLVAEGMPTALRAAAARLLGATGGGADVPPLRRILLGDRPTLLRRAAAAGLADLARAPGSRGAAVAALIAAIARPDIDAALTARSAAALGAAGATQAIPALTSLLDHGRPAAMRATWLAAAPDLGHTPAELWPTLGLEPSTRTVLLDSLACGETAADQPSSLEELGARQADQVASAAAEALAAIAGLRPALASDLCSRIRRAILDAPGPHPPAGLLRALAHAAGERVAVELATILDAPSGTPSLHWATLDQLDHTPQAADWLLERLRSATDDTFTRSKLVEIIGGMGDLRATPALRAIAISPAGDPHLRACAIDALGRIGTGDAGVALLQIAKDSEAPPPLRAAAIDALPEPLADPARAALRQIARAEGLAPPLVAAVGQRLARAGEREVLPLLLRAAQSEQLQESTAAIDAIAALGDQSAAPLLVRISQSPIAAPSVRLAAVAALLRLDGPAHLPLLQAYLESPLPPLQILAHQILAQIDPSDTHLIGPVTAMGAPLALRLAALERLSARSPAISLLAAIIERPDEPPQLRLGVARALGQTGQAEAAHALQAALAAGGPPLLRRRYITALGDLAAAQGEAGAAARAIIAALTQGDAAPAEERHWAAEILLDRALPKDIL
ncbi:MAG: HEAT repeat domain-containing protein, partial [Chloroflexales bacterium]